MRIGAWRVNMDKNFTILSFFPPLLAEPCNEPLFSFMQTEVDTYKQEIAQFKNLCSASIIQN